LGLGALLLDLFVDRGQFGELLSISGRHDVVWSCKIFETIAQRGEARHVELACEEILLDALAFGQRNRAVELDQYVSRPHSGAVADMDRGHDASLQRLDSLGAAGRHHLASRCRDNIDMAEACPSNRNRDKQDNGEGDHPPYGGSGRFQNLQRRGQEFTRVIAAPERTALSLDHHGRRIS